MYKIVVFVPVKNKEKVKMAMFNGGAGKIGNYDHCCFETMGTGQFQPLEGSNPVIGQLNKLEFVPEVRIEMVCDDQNVKDVVLSMKAAHPYEEVPFDLYPLTGIEDLWP